MLIVFIDYEKPVPTPLGEGWGEVNKFPISNFQFLFSI